MLFANLADNSFPLGTAPLEASAGLLKLSLVNHQGTLPPREAMWRNGTGYCPRERSVSGNRPSQPQTGRSEKDCRLPCAGPSTLPGLLAGDRCPPSCPKFMVRAHGPSPRTVVLRYPEPTASIDAFRHTWMRLMPLCAMHRP